MRHGSSSILRTTRVRRAAALGSAALFSISARPLVAQTVRDSAGIRGGRLLGDVSPPKGVEILEIGADYMIGLGRNEDDVEFIRVYSLIKPYS